MFRDVWYSQLWKIFLLVAILATLATGQPSFPDKFSSPSPLSDPLFTPSNVQGTSTGKFTPIINLNMLGSLGFSQFRPFHTSISASGRSSHPDDIYWDDRFSIPGVNGVVYCMVMNAQGELYIGGSFSNAGTVEVNNIAKWNGSQWESLGEGITGSRGNIVPSVSTMLLDGNKLYVAGEFQRAGGQSAENIAWWDGHQWHVLGNDTCNGVGVLVYALAKIDTSLYVSGLFDQICTPEGWIAAYHIARWDGNSWHSVGSGLNPGARIFAMLPIDTVLYCGGYIFEADGQPVRHVIRWDGHRWSPVGSGVNHAVYSMAVDEAGHIYVGGSFTEAGGKPARHLARWDGKEWSAVGSGSPGEGPNYPVISILPDSNDLYIGGYFTEVSGDTMLHIARWDGESWSSLDSGLDQVSWLGPSPAVYCMMKGNDGRLYAGGGFVQAGERAVNHLGIWDGKEWSTIVDGGGMGMNSHVTAMAVDSNGNVYVGGEFTCAGDIAANYIARWDGERWHPLGKGIARRGWSMPPVMAIAVADTNEVYVGGYFTKAGDVEANNIARWDGERWHALGDGPANGINDGWIFAIATGGNAVYAGGDFSTAGGILAHNIAQWDGSQWRALGNGINNGVGSSVSGITFFDNNVYVGGNFVTAGGDSAGRIAVWDGNSWSAIGNGISFKPGVNVRTIEFHQGDMYAGGFFWEIDSMSINSITRWDGTRWHALGDTSNNGVSGGITKIGFMGDLLYVGGWFYTAGGDSANCIASWNGHSWSPLGSGIQGKTYGIIPPILFTLAITDQKIYVGGNFSHSGQKAAYCFGLWHQPPTAIDRGRQGIFTFQLQQNHPNPFNPTTHITFSIPPGSSASTPVILKVYDVLGREVATIVNATLSPGEYTVEFDGSRLSSGIYLYRLSTSTHTAVKKMLLLK